MKKFKNTDYSDRKCVVCGSYLKKNLLVTHPNATLDWKCWYPKETKRRGGHGQGRELTKTPRSEKPLTAKQVRMMFDAKDRAAR